MNRNKNGSAPEPAPVVKLPKTLYESAVLDTEALPDGTVALVAQVPGATHIFPMTIEYAESLGRKLSAAKLIVPTGASAPIHTSP